MEREYEMYQPSVLDRSPVQPYIPNRLIRSSALQTALTNTRSDIPDLLFKWGSPILVDAGPDESGQGDGTVRLLAYFTPRREFYPSKGTVILLHGWVGCSHSNYNLVTMRELVNAGYDVFRLNLRDHGPGIHAHPQALNAGVFLGTLLNEVVSAITACAEMVQRQPVYVVGFSMGGNFALRSAIRHAETPIPNLRKVIAVNPAVNPLWSTQKIDQNLLFRRHFRRPWLEQLRQKQRYYPSLYDFEPVAGMKTLVEITNYLVQSTGCFRDAEEYFANYAVLGNATRDLTVPTLIITTSDDMIVSVADIYGLAPGPNLKVDIHPFGGHIGYIDGFPLQHQVGVIVREALEVH